MMGRVAAPVKSGNSTTAKTRLGWAQWMASKGITVFIVEAGAKRPIGGNSW